MKKPQTEFITDTGTEVELYVSYIVKNFMTRLKVTKQDSLGLSKFGEDIFFTDNPVDEHTDNTEKGKDTILCVLTNEADFVFVYDGESYAATPGRVFRFDGNVKHALRGHLNSSFNNKGRFSAVIWDIPVTNSFIKEVGKMSDRLISLIFELSVKKARKNYLS